MILRVLVLLAVVAAVLPTPATAHTSIVEVFVSQDAFPLSCTTAIVYTVLSKHSGEVTAIGLDDRNSSWTLVGKSGVCNEWSGDVHTWKGENSVSGSILNSYLETITQFDQTCTKLSNLKYLAQTNAVGPWDIFRSVAFRKLPCQSYSCEE